MRRHSPALLFLAAFVAVINLAFRPPAAVFAEESPPCAPTPDTTAEAPSNASLPPDPPPATTEPSPAAQPAAVLTMSELLPDPVGKDADGEFIEVHNAGASASMHGWLIIDGKGKVFSLPDAPIASGGYLVFPFSATALTLTNTGGSLTLHSPQGATETVTYPSLKEGIAWAKDSGEFQETSSPTPGAANSISSPSPATPEAPPAPPPPPPQVTPPSVPPATEIPPPAPPAALTVRISEALPDPAGSDEAEFIELENTGDVAASLDGWQLDDAEGGSRPYTFPSQTVIAARGFLLISHAVSDLVLNNTSDSIRLIDPSGTVRDSTQYADPKENASWSRGSDGTFDWTQQTPGAANATPASAAAAEMSASENDAEAVEDAVEEVAIAELLDLDEGTMAQVAAHILLAPGRLGLRTFAVQDDTGAIQARFTAAPPPGLKPGSGVVLLATLRRQNGKPYLSVGKNALTSTGASHAVHYVDFENEQPASRTAAATVTGSVVKTGGATLRLALADEHELRVSAAKDMKLPVLTKGDRVAAQGTVVWDSQGTPELLLEKDGLTTLPPEPEPDAPVQDSRAPQVIAAPEDAAERQAAPWPLVLLLLPPAGILAWKWRQHRASVASSVTIATEPASTPPPRPPLQLSSPSLSPSIAAMDWRPPRS